MSRKIEGDSLWKLCTQAVDMTIEDGTTATGFRVVDCLRNLKTITSPSEWSREFLFEFVAKTYFAIYCSQIGKRSGIPGKGVYFDEDSLNKSIANGLVLNEEKLAEAYSSKAGDLRVKKNAIDNQMAMDTNDPLLSLYQEMSLDALVDFILSQEEETV